MNFQKKTPEDILNLLREMNIKHHQVDYYAYPISFGDTAGPRGGVGGQAISDFTVECYVLNNSGPCVYLCNGMFIFKDEKFESFKTPKGIWKDLRKALVEEANQ